MAPQQLRDPKFWTVMLLYPCFYSILVDLMAILFEKLALMLNDFENHRYSLCPSISDRLIFYFSDHRTQTTFLNRLILKVFSFRIFTVFTALYFYAFVKNGSGAYLRISINIFALMTVGQWWGAFLDICLPALVHRALLFHMKMRMQGASRKIYEAKTFADSTGDILGIPVRGRGGLSSPASPGAIAGAGAGTGTVAGADSLGDIEMGRSPKQRHQQRVIEKREGLLLASRAQCWEEALLRQYSTFTDYTALLAQLGFVLFFAAVFPLAPVIALLNNLALIRLGAFKLCYTRKRPIAQKTSGIGVWENVDEGMSVDGILTNCALIGYTSQVLRERLGAVGSTGIALLLFLLEHLLLLLKYLLHTMIPQVPPSV